MWFSLFVHLQAASSLDIQHSGARSHKDKRVTEGKGHGGRCYDSLNITLFYCIDSSKHFTVSHSPSDPHCYTHTYSYCTHIQSIRSHQGFSVKDTWTHSLGEQGNKTTNAQRKPSTVALSRQWTVHTVIISGGFRKWPTPIHWTSGDTGRQQVLPQQHQTTLLFLTHDCESSLTLTKCLPNVSMTTKFFLL